nr:cytochrome b-c1 complex subunit Rieske-4, mitochondrial-like [Tanacetum cinerariifolium]
FASNSITSNFEDRVPPTIPAITNPTSKIILLMVLKFDLSMSASKVVLSLASLEVDLASIEPEITMTIKWRGKPVFIRWRTIDDDDFKDIEYVEASLPDPEIVSVEAGNNDISDDSSNDPLLEEADLFLAFENSIPPGIQNFAYDSEGDIRFLEALLSDASILFPNIESSEFDFDNPSFPRPLSEPPDAEDEFDVSNDEDVNFFPFMFVIYSNMFLSFLSSESEDTIFDPGISI